MILAKRLSLHIYMYASVCTNVFLHASAYRNLSFDRFNRHFLYDKKVNIVNAFNKSLS